MKSSIWIRNVRAGADISVLKVEVISAKRSFREKISQQVPILISLLALATAIAAQWQTIHHSKLSVRPQVSFLVEDNFGSQNVGLFIENNGLGPGRIERLSVYFDGKPVGAREMDAIYAKTRTLYRRTSPQWYGSEYAFHMKSGERMGVFFSPPSNIKSASIFLKLIEDRIFVIGEVCSLYDECHHFCTTVGNEKCLMEESRIRSLGTLSLQKKDPLF
jgi:hypothetical protein